jgi:predicted LPLAT superfamily acyltransferase
VICTAARWITDAVARERGGLLICAHLGNLELCRVLSRQRQDIKLTVLVHTKHAQAFNDMLAQAHPESQMNLMQVTEMTPATAMLLSEKIRAWRVRRDRRRPRSGVAQSTRGHGRLYRRAGRIPGRPLRPGQHPAMPDYLLFSIREGRSSTKVHFERFRESVRIPRQGREAALARTGRRLCGAWSTTRLRAPLQWFNFYDFWHSPQPERSDASR